MIGVKSFDNKADFCYLYKCCEVKIKGELVAEGAEKRLCAISYMRFCGVVPCGRT